MQEERVRKIQRRSDYFRLAIILLLIGLLIYLAR